MNQRVLVDTGPLVAMLSARDAEHQVCIEQMKDLEAPLLTCWPVLTEAAWLLCREGRAMQRLLGGVSLGLYEILQLDERALLWISKFLQRYRSLQPQLADAAIVYLAEREGIDAVFTLDRRDFSIYRLHKNRAFKILPSY